VTINQRNYFVGDVVVLFKALRQAAHCFCCGMERNWQSGM